MKILYIIHGLPIGGAEKVVVDYLLRLHNEGEDVSLLELVHVNSSLSSEIQKSGIPYYTLLRGGLLEKITNCVFPSLVIRRVNRFVRRIKPDVIHFHTIIRHLDSIDFPKSRCVFTFHSRVERTFNLGTWVKPLFERLSKTEMRFIVISSKVEEDMRRLFPLANIHLIPNGVDLENIRQYGGSRKTVRDDWGVDDECFVVGQVGRFNKVKNHKFTIDVFNIITQRKDKSLLVLVGTGTEQETEQIEERIEKYHLQDKVKMLGVRDDATRLMTGFDVLIAPSLSESFSLVLVEAQANNIRCVASDTIPSEVVCNKNSFQLSLNDSKEKWADAIMGMEERESSDYIENFNINNVVEQHLGLYKSLMQK